MRSTLLYLRASTLWGLLATTVAMTTGMLVIVALWPHTMWPLHGGAIGLVAGTSAWAVDERCATIVDVTSRPLWWRSINRAVPPLVLVVVWVSVHLIVRYELPDHLRLFLLQGVAAAVLGYAIGCLLRQRGSAEPGHRIAGLASPLVLGLALVRPAEEHVPLFPVWPHENWTRSTVIWVCLTLIGAGLLAWAFWSDARLQLRRAPGTDEGRKSGALPDPSHVDRFATPHLQRKMEPRFKRIS